jgi:hypothetical protein
VIKIKIKGIHEFRGVGEGGGLKYPLPPMKFLLKATLPPTKMFGKKMTFFQKFFDLSPLKIFHNLYPQAHVEPRAIGILNET